MYEPENPAWRGRFVTWYRSRGFDIATLYARWPMDSYQVQARRAARARERQRRARRRRVAALGAMAGVVLVVVAIVVASSGGEPSRQNSPRQRTARVSHLRASRGPETARRAHGGSTVTGTATGKPGRTPVPILTYHVIAPPPAGAPFPGLYVPAD